MKTGPCPKHKRPRTSVRGRSLQGPNSKGPRNLRSEGQRATCEQGGREATTQPYPSPLHPGLPIFPNRCTPSLAQVHDPELRNSSELWRFPANPWSKKSGLPRQRGLPKPLFLRAIHTPRRRRRHVTGRCKSGDSEIPSEALAKVL